MKARLSLAILLALIVSLALAGCTRQPRNDAQIATEVQGKIFSDPAIQSRQVTVNSSNGVVTLSGQVASDFERVSAENDARQIEGVKSVVNGLQVATAAAPPPANTEAYAPPAPQVEERRAPARTARRPSSVTPGLRRSPSFGQPTEPPRGNYAPTSADVAPARVQARPVTVPDGTSISVRMIDTVDTEKNNPGDTFRASLDSPVVINDQVIIPADADVTGRVVDLKSAGRFAGQSVLAVELYKLSYNGHTYDIRTNQYSRQGSSRGKSTATKVGGGAALGAIIGGLAGGGKGAAIGATVGAGAGTGVSAATKGQQIRLTSEQVLNFRLESPVTVMPSANADRNAGRQRLND